MTAQPDRELIYQALRFYFWAAGQGISPNADQDALEPEEGFWQYCNRTGDEDWETVAQRYRDRDRSGEADKTGTGLAEGESPGRETASPHTSPPSSPQAG